MKRILGLALFSLGAIALFGCPVYPGGGSGGGDNCSEYGGPCAVPTPSCQGNGDCPNGWYCANDGVCVAGTPSDCHTTGCPSGSVCTLTGGSLQCVACQSLVVNGASCVCSTTAAGVVTLQCGSADGGVGDATMDTGTQKNSDAGADAPIESGPAFTGCTSDAACAADGGAGAKCLDGVCYSAANQCSDSTQCPNSEQCVQGVCTPACSATISCATGFSCDTQNMVCTGNPAPCGQADGGAACGNGSTCVQEHCVDPCGEGGTCTGGLVCVDGGCIPNQQPNFVCNTDGVQDLCTAGSICLHHNCYIGCNPEAGASACMNAVQFNICKQVSTSTGTYNVCGSASNLGNQCDPTQGHNCASPQICIDGYCR